MPLVALPSLSLHVDEHGAGRAGVPVLLLHGLGSSGADWDGVAPALAQQRRVIVPDMRGHGRSDKPPGAYEVPTYARDVAALCDALGVRAVHVVGLSMGGMIAFQLAVTRPDLVATLTIVNSGPDMVPRTWRMKALLTTRLVTLRLLGPRRFGQAIAKRLFPKPTQAEERRVVGERLGANDLDVYLRATRGLIGWSVLDRLASIACPVLVLSSDRDYTPVAAKEAYVKLLGDARLEVITDSGHAAPGDQPEQVAARVSTFLSATEATTSLASTRASA